MDTVTASKSKPRSRLFDCAIKSVRNQSSSKLKMNEAKSLDPVCISSKRQRPPKNANSKTSVTFEKKSSSEAEYSTESSVIGCSSVKESSLNPKKESQKKLCDSSSNNNSIDYNLPITSSDILTVNPEVLHSSEVFEESKGNFTSNNNDCSSIGDILLQYCKAADMVADSIDNFPLCDSDKATSKSQSDFPSLTILDPFFARSRTEIFPPDRMVDFDGYVENSVKSDVLTDENFKDDGFLKPVPDSSANLARNMMQDCLTNGLMFDKPSKNCLNNKERKKKNKHGGIIPQTRKVYEKSDTCTEIKESPHSNSTESEFSKCNMRQDSHFYERSPEYSLPISISICDSLSAKEEAVASGSTFLTNDSCNVSSSDTSGKKVSSHSVTIVIKVLNSEGSSKHSFPISVQVCESEGKFKESSISLCPSNLEEKHRQETGTDYRLPVTILISESGSTLSSEDNLWDSDNVKNRISKCNISILSGSLVDSGFHTSVPFGEQRETDYAMTKAISGNNLLNNSTRNTIPSCISSNFPPNEILRGNIKNRYYGHTHQFFNRSDVSLQQNSVYYSPPIRNFVSDDGSVKDFSPNNLCRNCFEDYSHELNLLINKFKSRLVDKTLCSCIDSSVNIECSEESSASYSLPVFPPFCPKTSDINELDISPDFPTNPIGDWKLPVLPDDFSLPICNLCCDMNIFSLEEEENINPLSSFGVKSSFFNDNVEVDNSYSLSDLNTDACNDSNEKIQKKLDRRQGGNCWVPGYNSERLLSLKTEPKFIDAHCHLDFLFQKIKYSGTFKAYKLLNEKTFPNNYGGCVAVFCNPETFAIKPSWEKYLEEENVWATFGCHPHFSRFYCEKYENVIIEALNHSQVRALGEIGLDYSKKNHCSKEVQINVFRRQLKITVSKKLPLVIHCREAHEDTLRLAREILPENQKIHLHCFTDTWDEAEKWIEAFPNLCIGFTNRITLNTDENVYHVVKNMPLDRLLLETDAPYFVPKVYGKSRKWSHPGMAIHVAAQIAAIKQIDIEEVLHWTRKNTNSIYGI